MRISSILAWVVLSVAVCNLAFAQETPPAPPPPTSPTPPAVSDASRLDRIEKELAATKAELETLKVRQETRAKVEAGGPSAVAQGEKFEKKFGKDAIVTWKDGFSLVFLDEKEPDPESRVQHRFNVNGRLQADVRIFQDDDHPQHDRFFLRRARIKATGTFWKYSDFSVEFDLGQSSFGVREGYVNLGYWKLLQFRFGQFKEPFLLENVQSDLYLDFLERNTFLDAAKADYDMGAMVHGDFGYGTYYLAAVNGTGTNAVETNDDKEFLGRIVLTPFKPDGGPLEHLLLGASVTWSHEKNFIPAYRTEGVDGGTIPTTAAASQFLFIPAGVLAAGTTQRGDRVRFGLESRINFAPITVQAEYAQMRVDDILTAAGTKEDLTTHGAYIDVLFMLTGEEHPNSKRIIPKANFNPHEGGWGAWELGVRWDHLQVDGNDVREIGMVGAHHVNALILGINWYLNPLFKIQFNYDRNFFNKDAANTGRDTEDVFMARIQVEF